MRLFSFYHRKVNHIKRIWKDTKKDTQKKSKFSVSFFLVDAYQ